jgi:hypothetical protein
MDDDAFSLKIAALGAASLVIGLSELSGESLVSASPTASARSAVGAGIILNCLVALALPFSAPACRGAGRTVPALLSNSLGKHTPDDERDHADCPGHADFASVAWPFYRPGPWRGSQPRSSLGDLCQRAGGDRANLLALAALCWLVRKGTALDDIIVNVHRHKKHWLGPDPGRTHAVLTGFEHPSPASPPADPFPTPTQVPTGAFYTVQTNDTLLHSLISGVSVEELRA